MKRILLLLVLSMFLAGCGESVPTPFAVTIPAAQSVNVIPSSTPSHTPTVTPTPTTTNTPTYTPTYTPSLTPTLTYTPTNTPTPTITPSLTPSSTSTPIPTATFSNPADDPNYTPPPSWTPPPENPGATLNDHYQLRRPISDGGTNWIDRTYPYGSTGGGRFRVHHGVEFQNPSGTPVLAAGNGMVFYAGGDISNVFGPQPNYYGNIVIIQHSFTSPEGLPVYSVYGHLSRVDVTTGQSIGVGERIGVVGAEGVALGPHLHFEVRVGDPNSFFATRNPELWIYPYFGFGTLAGRVTDSSGNILRDVTIQVDSATGKRDVSRFAFSYAADSVNSDPAFGENFTLGDLPANYYDVTVRANGRRLFQQVVYVYPNKTTWLNIRLES